MKRSAGPSGGDVPDDLPFERAIARLEEIVDRLEGGELELEQALGAFEEGVGLSRRCAQQLAAAERRIEVLTREGGKWLAAPLDTSGDPEPDEGS